MTEPKSPLWPLFPQLESISTLLQSQSLTFQMCILYLHQYCLNSQALKMIIDALNHFKIQQQADWLPMIVHIYSMCQVQLLEDYLYQLASKSIPMYLCVRWSLSTYIDCDDQLEKMRNKLDMKFVNVLSMKGFGGKQIMDLNGQEIEMLINKKQILSNYINVLNNFYHELFTFPDKLKESPAHLRKSHLNSYLSKLLSSLTQQQQSTNYGGICLPFSQTLTKLESQSIILLNFIYEQSIPFSTKQRVPFKIVFETINFDDYDSLFQDVQHVRKIHQNLSLNKNTMASEQRNSYVLPHSYFGEDWNETVKNIVMQSQYGHLNSHAVRTFMVKSGDDIRQQYLAMQLIQLFHKIFKTEHLKLWVKPYQIVPYDKESGFIQFIDQTKTISTLKQISNENSLRIIYKQIFGENWESAVTNFTKSLAGYSLFQYLFQVKDRHNNNILIDDMGHLIHIDFSFMISNSPGNLNFQKAPFKFTQDYVELMEGFESDLFKHFKFLLYTGIKFMRKYKKEIMGIIDIMSECSEMRCFSSFDRKGLERRFHENSLDSELQNLVQLLINQSFNSYSTNNYDRYQWLTNSIKS